MVFEEKLYSGSSFSAKRFQDSWNSDSASGARAASNDARKRYYRNFEFSKTVSPMVARYVRSYAAFEFILM